MANAWRGLRLSGPLGLAVVLASVALGSTPAAARAATSVTCADSPSDQAAVQAAVDGGGTVLLRGHCLGDWIASVNVTLTGLAGAVLDGNAAGTVLTVTNQATVSVNNLSITNGSAPYGGGIFADSGTTVRLNNAAITANSADSEGGGVYAQNLAYVTLTGSSVTRNRTQDLGGGIAVVDAFLSATSSTATGNDAFQGGGIGARSSDLLLTNMRVSANTASGFGGGIASFDNGSVDENLGGAVASSRGAPFARQLAPQPVAAPTLAPPRSSPVPSGLTLINSSVDHNSAFGQGGGGVVNVAVSADSLMTLTNTSVSFNNVPALNPVGAGGIANVGVGFDATAMLTITGSQLVGNLTPHGEGGAIYNVSQGGTSLLSLASTSISSQSGFLNPNQAARGGGIYQDATLGAASLSLANGAKIVHNKASVDGGGIYNACSGGISKSFGAVVLLNSPNNIVAAPCGD